VGAAFRPHVGGVSLLVNGDPDDMGSSKLTQFKAVWMELESSHGWRYQMLSLDVAAQGQSQCWMHGGHALDYVQWS